MQENIKSKNSDCEVERTPLTGVQRLRAVRMKRGVIAQIELASEGPRELWAEYIEKPCIETRNDLVVAYQKLVGEVVSRFLRRLPPTIDRGDLETAANVGLIRAIAGFDPLRGVRFESYCERRLKGALLDELRAQDWLPRPWRQRIESQKRMRANLRAELGRKPMDNEVAAGLNMSLEEYERMFGTGLPGAPQGSMPMGNSEEQAPRGIEVVADKFVEPADRLSSEELLTLVAQKLTEAEYRLVYLRYWEELPMREIGQLLGLSESRVCKIHTRLLERLKDRFRVGVLEN
jgi:RNA polymerase sigma factor for flagellar operon FliA